MKTLWIWLICICSQALNAQVVELRDTAVTHSSQAREVSYSDHKQIENRLEELRLDTQEMMISIRDLRRENAELREELYRFKHGVFFGIGFGFNYFLSSPPNYYLKTDSTIGVYGNESGMSFILSGFMAYKINEKHSLIFNVPLGDITNRDEFKIGLFNQKMAGGIGYGRNLGNVSIIGIINISPYDKIELEVVEDEKFRDGKFSKVDPSDLPSTTYYSPSFTIGFSYNFVPGNGSLDAFNAP